MPTYDYVCDACGHALEIFQSMSEAPKKKCPKCGKSKLARRIGAGAGFLFKGSGFYLTDYRSKSYTAQARSEAERNKETSGQPGADPATPAPASESKAADKPANSADSAPKSSAPSASSSKSAPAKKKPAKGD